MGMVVLDKNLRHTVTPEDLSPNTAPDALPSREAIREVVTLVRNEVELCVFIVRRGISCIRPELRFDFAKGIRFRSSLRFTGQC